MIIWDGTSMWMNGGGIDYLLWKVMTPTTIFSELSSDLLKIPLGTVCLLAPHIFVSPWILACFLLYRNIMVNRWIRLCDLGM